MAKKSVIEQIKDTQEEINILQVQKKQQEHQLEKHQAREREKERKERTRKKIERGAIIDSMNPQIASLTNQQLKVFLQQVLQSERALHLLSKMTETENVG
ncbi:hypothetical protein [Tannockella kyphosi]|uniref:hypothetical protein n=1 Tax=Tannockella kyphosi TaxID=2899121 RepID=UPI002010EFF9|nr:hypothetical protein [Tannockella kyphosi]